MPTSYAIPHVGVMGSTALADSDVDKLLQGLFIQSLGIDPATDPNAYSRVRIDWPTPGQPAWLITEDVAFIRSMEATDAYNMAHEAQQAGTYDADGNYVESTIYTRAWDISLIFYGPNSFDRARQVKASLFQDFTAYQLAAKNLYVIPTVGTTRRGPELFAGQWWQRSDFSFRMYEQVTDTLTKLAVDYVEIHIRDATGQGSDIVIQDPQQ